MKRAMTLQASPLDGYPKEEGGDWLNTYRGLDERFASSLQCN